jgi:tetratricopeptide (TPR) repeat protein
LEIREMVFGPHHPLVAISLDKLATLYEVQGQHEKAEPLFTRALEIFEKASSPNLPFMASVLMKLAEIYRRTGREAQAQAMEKRAALIEAIVR